MHGAWGECDRLCSGLIVEQKMWAYRRGDCAVSTEQYVWVRPGGLVVVCDYAGFGTMVFPIQLRSAEGWCEKRWHVPLVGDRLQVPRGGSVFRIAWRTCSVQSPVSWFRVGFY